ncbi:hypothetical protein HPB50_027826 [Hyalomma asiaticum]|nr:hypothetical protein HPB50_027826 [Hyalomma asiaticum]
MRFLCGLISNRGTTCTFVGSNRGQQEEAVFVARSTQGQAPAGHNSLRAGVRRQRRPPPRHKARKSKTAKKFPVRSGGSGLWKFGKLGDTSVPSPSPHHRNPVTPGGAELRRPLFDRRPCLTHSWHGNPLAQSISLVRRLLFAPSMPDNGASRKVKRRWSRNTPPSGLLARRTGGRSSTTSPLPRRTCPVPSTS